MQHFKSLIELHRANGFPPPENPMLSMVQCRGSCLLKRGEFYTTDAYMIGLKNTRNEDHTFGRTNYDHESGAMFFMKPNQVVSNIDNEVDSDGFVLYIQKNFLHGHSLYDEIKHFGYFDYGISEALHLSPKENGIIWEIYHRILKESNSNIDAFSKEIILSQVTTLLHYAHRFYIRQFVARKEIMGQTARNFNALMSEYVSSGRIAESGLPSVKFIADRLNLTSRYLSDLLRQETGKTALEMIHIFLVTEAKHLLKTNALSIKEVAYRLGFENRPYFSRMFKKELGITPIEFKKSNHN